METRTVSKTQLLTCGTDKEILLGIHLPEFCPECRKPQKVNIKWISTYP